MKNTGAAESRLGLRRSRSLKAAYDSTARTIVAMVAIRMTADR